MSGKIIDKYDDDTIKEKIASSLKVLFLKDFFLLDNNVHERTIAHRLGMYLQPLFPHYEVDCEYDKKIIDPKLLKGINSDDEQKKTERIIPDIIIHKRNSSDNLVVIEIKSKLCDTTYDIKKVELLTDANGEYKYKLGFLINFPESKIASDMSENIKIFKNGTRIKDMSPEFFENSYDSSSYLSFYGGTHCWDIDNSDENDYEYQQDKYLDTPSY